LYAATVTEFDPITGAPVCGNIERYMAYLVQEQACDGAFVNGTSGESMSLSNQERKDILSAWQGARVKLELDFKLIAHVGCNSLSEARDLAEHAQRIGADAIAVMTPNFFKPASASILVEYLAAVASAAPQTPCLYYHFPAVTGVSIPAADIVRLSLASASFPTFAGMKFTSVDMVDYGNCCSADPDGKLAFLPGYEGQTIAYLPYHAGRGCYGAVGLLFSVLGTLHKDMSLFAGLHWERALTADDMKTALELQEECRTFLSFASKYGIFATVKETLLLKGIIKSAVMRLPQESLSEESVKRLKVDLETFL
ncbi:unnamed protein product, partial [Ectocarpus fasciculatus]